MKRVVLTAGAVLLLTAPAFADQLTIEKQTITRDDSESSAPATSVVIAPTPPPPPQAEVPPPPPGPGVAWLAGHWRWDSATAHYVWFPGRYAELPRAHAAWVEGRFERRPDGWEWVEGHWD